MKRIFIVLGVLCVHLGTASAFTLEGPGRNGYLRHEGCLLNATDGELSAVSRFLQRSEDDFLRVTSPMIDGTDHFGMRSIRGCIQGWATPGAGPHSLFNPPRLTGLPGSLVHLLRPIGASALAVSSETFTDAAGDYSFKVRTSDGVVSTTFDSESLRVLDRAWVDNATGECDIFWIPPKFTSGNPDAVEFCYKPHVASADVSGRTYDLFLDFESAGDLAHVVAMANAYSHLTATEDWIQGSLPDWEKPDSVAFVNLDSVECNAFVYMGTSIMNFGLATEDCPNTAYSSVVRHEYGHVWIETFWPVDQEDPTAWAEGVDIAGFHEGVSDTLAALSMDTPCMGKGFFAPGECGRRIDEPDVGYPLDMLEYPDAHHRGKALSGAFWDLRTLLVDLYGETEGREVAKDLFLHAVYRAGIAGTGLSYHLVEHAVDVDYELHQGDHEALILDAFGRHGLVFMGGVTPIGP